MHVNKHKLSTQWLTVLRRENFASEAFISRSIPMKSDPNMRLHDANRFISIKIIASGEKSASRQFRNILVLTVLFVGGRDA
jgi:hypothetical protein